MLLESLKEQNINFQIIKDQTKIEKNEFLDVNQNKTENLFKVTLDTQGIIWRNLQRDINIRMHVAHQPGYRNITQKNQKEIEERIILKATIKNDIFFQYNSFFMDIPVYINHFQVRKNLKMVSSSGELIYTKQFGLESFNLITKKKQTLIPFKNEEMLCFDVKKEPNHDTFICIGEFQKCSLYKISKENLEKVKKRKVNTTPNSYQNSFLKVEGVDNRSLEASINYVMFMPNNRIVLTTNDCLIKFYDMNEISNPNGNGLQFSIISDSPINHCDFNEEKNICVTVGDTTTIDIFDLREKKCVSKLTQCFDYGIVVKFNEYDTNFFAAGNQDGSCRIYDIRNMNSYVRTFYGENSTISDLKWISREEVLGGESYFFAYPYNMQSNTIQKLEFFGMMSGLDYDPLKKKAYVSVFNSTEEGGIMCYERISSRNFLEFYDI